MSYIIFSVLIFIFSIRNIRSIISGQLNCATQYTCLDCIKYGCFWCIDEGYTSVRCSDKKTTNCERSMPVDAVVEKVQSNEIFSSSIIKVTQSIGQTVTITLNASITYNVPIAVTFLVDVSYSMDKIIFKVKQSLVEISNMIKEISSNVKMSVVTTSDLPFPIFYICTNPPCTNIFFMRLAREYTEDVSLIQNTFNSIVLVANTDSDESQLLALMKILECNEWLGHPSNTRKIIIILTDSESHVAGDGYKGGLKEMYKTDCTINNNYLNDTKTDFPTISTLMKAIDKSESFVIVGTTNYATYFYNAIQRKLTSQRFQVQDILTSSDIVSAIQNILMKSIKIITYSPAKYSLVEVLDVSFDCRNDGTFQKNCSNLATGSLVPIKIVLRAIKCTDDEFYHDIALSMGIHGAVRLQMKINCLCGCESFISSKKTCQNGNYSCGTCVCEKTHAGKLCDCPINEFNENIKCLNSNKIVCSNNGICECNKCRCFQRYNSVETTTGNLCECTNWNCPRFNNLVCGGSNRGVCECNVCKCREGYIGDMCQEKICTSNEIIKNCKKNSYDQDTCSSKGTCNCGDCECNYPYSGKLCEDCLACKIDCNLNEKCVHCIVESGGSSNCTDDCTLPTNILLPSEYNGSPGLLCLLFTKKLCEVKYGPDNLSNPTNLIIVYEKNKDCSTFIITAAVSSIVISAVVSALICIIITVLSLYIYRLNEYKKFMKEKNKASWNNMNPIYKNTVEEFSSPLQLLNNTLSKDA